MYNFQFPNDTPPSEQDCIKGFVHYVADLLNLHGAGKHLVSFIKEYEQKPLDRDLVETIMQANIKQIDIHKGILDRCSRITINVKGGDEE